MMKQKRSFHLVLWYLSLMFAPCLVYADLVPMTKTEMGETVGQAGVDVSVLGSNIMRYFFDVHVEVYAEIDSVKLGYYHRTDLTTRKFMGPIDDDYWDPHLSFNYNKPGYEDGTFNYAETIDGTDYMIENARYYIYKDDNGDNHYLPYVDNNYYMHKYSMTEIGDYGLVDYYAEGEQGQNKATIPNLVYGVKFSDHPTENTNYLDWDINLQNLRLGTSPEEPLVINGLVINMKYDKPVTEPTKRLTDIIIGTNDARGSFYGDFHRITGLVSGKPAFNTRNTAIQDQFIPLFTKVPVPVSLKRDSFLTLVDSYHLAYNDPNDGDGYMVSRPGDPVDNQIHTGMFLRIGLDPTSENFGYAIVVGYNELIASTYKPHGEMIRDTLLNWWEG